MAKSLALLNKYRGSLVGAVVGDCLGSPFECLYWDTRLERVKIIQKIGVDVMKEKSDGSRHFTDDTAMAKSVCSSLLFCKEFDAVDMATKFLKEYLSKPNRGYGGGVITVFQFWKENGINKKNVYQPSLEQFNGSGSYGNGAAMRVAPVALFAKSSEDCIQLAKSSALLTHSNKNGYIGAILQALAVYQVLTMEELNVSSFIENLKNEISKLEDEILKPCGTVKKHNSEVKVLEENNLHEFTRSPHFTYCHQLDTITELLQLYHDNVEEDDVEIVQRKLGHDVSAQQAVPAAIYSFLRNLGKGFEETLFYAISLGGDTDTIAAICCAMSGAYYGYQSIPTEWIKVCEGSNMMDEFAQQLHAL